MKKIKKGVLLFITAMMILLPMAGTSLPVSAAEPVTYYLRYVEGNGELRYMPGSSWDDTKFHRELYYLEQEIKDGDIIVILTDGRHLSFDFNVRLSNLTIKGGGAVVADLHGIDDCYVLDNSLASITGDITNLYMYGKSIGTFHNNVTNLYVVGDGGIDATVEVIGTVNYVKGSDNNKTYYECYSFRANKLRIKEGKMKTEEADFTYVKPEDSGNPVIQSTAPADSAAPAAPADSDEYDDVPKTGESHLWFWLLCISACFGIAGLVLRRQGNHKQG